jgi:transposase
MKDSIIVGIDVSKSTLDIYVKPVDQGFTINNDSQGFKQFIGQLKAFLKTDKTVLVVMEHTGLYSHQLENFLQTKGIYYCKIPAMQIKRSMGMVRGKDDKIDAQRIAEYGWLRRDQLAADEPVSKPIIQLKHLLSLRLLLVRQRAGLRNRIKEIKAAGIAVGIGLMEKSVEQQTQHILNIEQEIRDVIVADKALQQTHQLLSTMKGIGFIIAATMISSTHNFTRFKNARKFNCYAGIAPFKHQSGTSIKGRSRVSHLANKESKTMLNLAAMCAIRYDAELKSYYTRKVQEGKNKMACLNAVRSKIVARMFAVIKRQTPYQEHRLTA